MEKFMKKQYFYTKMTLDALCTGCFYSFNFTYRYNFVIIKDIFSEQFRVFFWTTEHICEMQEG